MYEYLDAAVVRAPAWQPECQDLPWPDLTGQDAGREPWREWLEVTWQVTEFAQAVAAASPDLARQVARIRNDLDVSEAAMRRAVLSTLRYLLRASSRATPFGLLAGIAPARTGRSTRTEAGTRHRATVRPDAAWITGVIEYLEADPDLRPRLTVVASSLAVRRDGHLVIEHRPRGATGGAPERVRARATQPVLAVVEAARYPTRVADLAGLVSAGFPSAPRDVIDVLIAGLIGQRFLITSLRSSVTAPDPLACLLGELDALVLQDTARAAAVRARLHAISEVLAGHDAPVGHLAEDRRARASALMTALYPAARTVLAVDLRLDWELTIPHSVLRDAASAAGVLTRLARRPALNAGWVAWHARFLDRYGPGAVVPVLDAVNASTGLGYPAGYLGSAQAVPANPLTARDKTLLRVAQAAAMRGQREVVLDASLIIELAAADPGGAVQPSAEITVRVHADSVRGLDEGRYTLHVTGVSRGAGTTTGRFLTILDPTDRERMTSLYAGLPGIHRDSLLAQVCAAPLHASTGNVARAPRSASLVISLGEPADPAAGHIPLTDLAITADPRRLHLVSISRRRPVHTLLLSAVDLACHSQPLARFLTEAPVALAAPCTGFDWGAASALPFLPALRHGRVVLSAARWIITASDLPGAAAGWRHWDDALTAWQQQARLPRWVYLGEGDRCIRLHLAEPSHRALFRAHLDRASKVTLRTAPAPEDLGWADGRVHEIVIPVAAAGQSVAPVRWPGEVAGPGHGYLPGCEGRLCLHLHSCRDQQDAILTRLPGLIGHLGSLARNWWFIRYNTPADHLRLRLSVNPDRIGPAIEQVSTWTLQLRHAELITNASWESYYPETARFGGTATLAPAEKYFAADSAAVIAQLSACTNKEGPDPQALTSASLADITVSLIGDKARAMHWLAGHTAPDPAPPPRALRDQAVALINAAGDAAAGTPAPGAAVAAAWAARSLTLSAYRDALERAGTIAPADLLPDLLHLHHARMAGPDLAAERACLHLARAGALSWLARARKAP